MSLQQNIQLLSRFMPVEAAPLIARWVNYFQVEIKITKSRSSVYGDYRHPHGIKGHRISVNHDQNPYAFLITMVHEFAHLTCWNKYKNAVKPHGDEWKKEFKELMTPFFELKIFPDEIVSALKKYLHNPAASSCSDMNLMNVLHHYDQSKGTVLIKNIPPGSIFNLRNGKVFKKGDRIRTRFRCLELESRQIYFFSPTAEVYLRNDGNTGG